MALNIQNSRLEIKYSTISGASPSIAPSQDHTDGTWTADDIYVGEFYLNAVDDQLWVRTLNGIYPILSASTSTPPIYTFVNKTGDTMTGDLIAPGLSASTITGGTIIGGTMGNTSSVHYGDGSNLTGIVTTWNGGTVSGTSSFTSGLDLTNAQVQLDEINTSGLNINGNTFINGDVQSLGGVFIGDGSGLYNLPGITYYPLSDVLSFGNSTGLNWIDVYRIPLDEEDGRGIRSNDAIKDRELTFNYDGIELKTYRNSTDDISQIFVWDDRVRIISKSDTGMFPVNEAFIDTYPNGDITINNTNALNITSDAIVIAGQSGSFSGVEYDQDYSVNYSNRSLVDKEYVDNAVSATTPNLGAVLTVGNNTGNNNIELNNNPLSSTSDNIVAAGNTLDDAKFSFEDLGSGTEWAPTMRVDDGDTQNYVTVGKTDTYIHSSQVGGLINRYSQVKLNNGAFANVEMSSQNIADGEYSLIRTRVDGNIVLENHEGVRIEFYTPMLSTDPTNMILSAPNEIILQGGDMNIIGQTGSFPGIKYNSNYSANFTNRSLVDKEYVDSTTLAGPTGSTINPDVSPTASTSNFDGYNILGKSTTGVKEFNFGTYMPKRSNTQITTNGTHVLATVPLTNAAFDFFEFKYTAINDVSGREVGTVTAFYDINTDSVNFSRTGPVSIGDVVGFDLDVIQTGSTLQLVAIITDKDWNIYVHSYVYPSGFSE